MSYQVIERRIDSDEEIELAGRTYPVPAVVEDADGIRLLLNAGRTVGLHLWVWATQAGASAVVDVEAMRFALAPVFESEREQLGDELVLPPMFWLPYEPDLTYVQMATLDPREVDEVEQDRQGAPGGRPRGFVHLHTHSEHSALDGLSTMREIVEAVVAQGGEALAVTDHGNCAPHPVQALECERAGIRPVFGMEAYFVDDRHDRESRDYYHLVIWALDDRGLRNLWALSTASYADEARYYKPRIDWELLERHQEGLLVSTACLRGPLAHAKLGDSRYDRAPDEELALANLARLKGIFGDRLYIELHANRLSQQIEINNWSVEIAEEYDVPLLAVVDSHYAHSEDKVPHRVWLSAQTNTDVADDSALFGGDQDYHLMTETEVREALSYLDPEVVDEAVANTVRLARRCTASMSGKGTNPVFSRPTKEWPDPVEHDVSRLFDLCMERWDARTRGKTHRQRVYLRRFEREFDLIVAKGFAGYFLMVADFVNWAKDHEVLVGPGRGSGGGSLVAYLLRITEIDPVEADLLFERFMTEGRTALPDFDIDFPSTQKQVMLGYVAERWGADHMATVGTHMRLKSKGTVKDIARAMKSVLPEDHFNDINAVSKIIEAAEAGTAGLGMSWEDLWAEHGEVLNPFRERYPELFEMCDRLHGRLKTYGTHPAGVIIDPDHPLAGALPLRNGEHGMVTQFDMEALERLGFVKFDMLNLRTLDTLQRTLELIKQTTGRWIDIYDWTEQYTDPQIFGEISEGWTLGIFQIETTSGTQMTRRFQPQNLAELADVITLVRPGPVRSGLTETYFRRRIGEEEVYVPDARLEPVLAKTNGCMVYQEDIMAAVMVLAAYGSDEADTVRRILGKKKVEAVLAEGQKFIARAIENGTDSAVAEELWEQMAEFAKYSFNRAHAFAYAVLGIWTAWFKFHYPVQFLTAALSTVKDERIPEFVEEARRMDYAVQPPDINESGDGFSASEMTVRYGFLAIKGLGEAACEAILTPRAEGGPYTSFEDFLARKGPKCNSGHVKRLVAIGAFDSLHPNRRALAAQIERAEFVGKGTDSCRWKVEAERPVFWIESKGTELTEHEVMLPCTYDWPAEPEITGRTGKPVKRKAPPKRCTRTCRRFAPIELPDLASIEPYTDEEIRNTEMEVLGVFLSSTPFDRLDPDDRAELSTGVDVLVGGRGTYIVAGLVRRVRAKSGGDRYGRPMGWITVMTERGELEVTVFHKAWAKHREDLVSGSLCLMAIEKNGFGQNLAQLEPLD